MVRRRLTHEEKYGRDDEELNERSGPRILGTSAEEGKCSYLPDPDEGHCGATPFLHVAVLDQRTERVIELTACTQHTEAARAAAKNEGRFTNEHRYQFGLCDQAIDWQCHKGRIA